MRYYIQNSMIPFSPPKIYQEIIDEVVDTLKSGWITTGPKTKQLEKELAAFCHAKKALCLNSATAGMELMLRWFNIGEGDEVILPAYTYCATANVVLHCGATPIMVDVDENFNIDVEEVKKKINSKTKAIIPVDIGGFPCNYDDLNKIIRSKEIVDIFKPNSKEQEQLGRILLMADSAHSFGGKYQNKTLGTDADTVIFSFHAVKNLTTAEGGAVILNLPPPFDNEEIYQVLNIKSLHGQTKDALSKTKGNWRYDVIEAGYKSNMTDILASLGLVELKRYASETIPRRKEIFKQYQEAFEGEAWAETPQFKSSNKEGSYHLYMLRIKDISERQRDAIIEEIYKNGVAVNVHFQPLPLLSLYKNLGYKIEDYPKAFDNYSREITLPVYYDLTDKDVKIVIQTVKNAVRKILS